MTTQLIEASDGSALSVVAKAVLVLEAFGPTQRARGVSDLARRSGLPKSTAHRLLGALEKCGLVQRQAGGYLPGGRLQVLIEVLRGSYSAQLRDVLMPYLQDVYELTHETVHLAVLQDHEVLFVERLHGRRSSAVYAPVGARLPAHCVAAGKALLAYTANPAHRGSASCALPAVTTSTHTSGAALELELRRVRRQGLAFDRGEFAPGVTSVAVPVFAGSRVVGALSVMGSTSTFDPYRVAGPLLRLCRDASSAMHDALASTPPATAS